VSAAPQTTWRFVVRAYLDALYEDARRRHESELSNCEARCLREFAAEALWRQYAELIQHRIAMLGNTPPESAYELIEESGQQVVVPVPRGSTDGWSIPFFATRFVLSQGDAGWKIAAMLAPCISCSPLIFESTETPSSRKIGVCFFCGGSGKRREFERRGLWIFRRVVQVPPPCKYCQGTGRCQECASSSERGWVDAWAYRFGRPAAKEGADGP